MNIDTLFVLDFKANKAFGYSPESNKERLACKHPELIRYLPDGHDKDWMIQQKILSPAYKNVRFLMLVYDEVVNVSQTEEYRNEVQINVSDLDGFKVPDFILQKMKIFFTELSRRSQNFLANSQYLSNLNANMPLTSSTLPANTLQKQVSNQMTKPKTSLSSSHATLSALLSSPAENVGVSGISTTSATSTSSAKTVIEAVPHVTAPALLSNPSENVGVSDVALLSSPSENMDVSGISNTSVGTSNDAVVKD